MVDTVGGQQPSGVLLKHDDLVRRPDVERIDPVVRHPADVGVDRFGGQLDALGIQRREDGGHPHGPASRIGGHGRVEHGVRGEAPRTVDDHPHRHPDLAVDDGGFHLTIAQRHDLRGDAVNAQVGVARPGSAGGRQRGIGQFVARKSEEVGIDSSERCHDSYRSGALPARLQP